MREDRFFRGIVEGMSCGVLTVDVEARLLTMNGHARVILEVSEQDARAGAPLAELLSHHPRLVDTITHSLSCETLPSRAELESRTRDGGRRALGFSISRILDGTGSGGLGLAVFFKDLTQVERQVEQARLRDRLAALGEMAAQMAHQIRNPVASIAVSAQRLTRRLEVLKADGDTAGTVHRIQSAVERIDGTIASCLEYVRPVTPEFRPQEIGPMLALVADEARRTTGAVATEIVVETEPEDLVLRCDRLRLMEALTILVVNALEALETPEAPEAPEASEAGDPAPAGRIVLTACPVDGPQGGVTIRVRDNGPGIPDDLLDRIFTPFFTTKARGTGVGLAMARKVVEAHRGVIDVGRTDGGGTTFTLRLPSRPEPGAVAEAAVEDAPAEALPAGTSRR